MKKKISVTLVISLLSFFSCDMLHSDIDYSDQIYHGYYKLYKCTDAFYLKVSDAYPDYEYYVIASEVRKNDSTKLNPDAIFFADTIASTENNSVRIISYDSLKDWVNYNGTDWYLNGAAYRLNASNQISSNLIGALNLSNESVTNYYFSFQLSTKIISASTKDTIVYNCVLSLLDSTKTKIKSTVKESTLVKSTDFTLSCSFKPAFIVLRIEVLTVGITSTIEVNNISVRNHSGNPITMNYTLYLQQSKLCGKDFDIGIYEQYTGRNLLLGGRKIRVEP